MATTIRTGSPGGSTATRPGRHQPDDRRPPGRRRCSGPPATWTGRAAEARGRARRGGLSPSAAARAGAGRPVGRRRGRHPSTCRSSPGLDRVDDGAGPVVRAATRPRFAHPVRPSGLGQAVVLAALAAGDLADARRLLAAHGRRPGAGHRAGAGEGLGVDDVLRSSRSARTSGPAPAATSVGREVVLAVGRRLRPGRRGTGPRRVSMSRPRGARPSAVDLPALGAGPAVRRRRPVPDRVRCARRVAGDRRPDQRPASGPARSGVGRG